MCRYRKLQIRKTVPDKFRCNEESALQGVYLAEPICKTALTGLFPLNGKG